MVHPRRAAPVVLVGALAACGARTSLDAEDAETTTAPPSELCNDVDDDGDGAIDEDLGVERCGVGACAREMPRCIDGELVVCQPGEPGVESCNGADDDCDGATDEGLGLVRVAGPKLIDTELHYLARSQIVATSNGLLVVYATSFDGMHPTPNVRLARLDADAQLLGAPEILTTRNMPNGPRLAPAQAGWAVTYCGRFGTDDHAASGLLGEDGSFVEHGERSPHGMHCGAGNPDGIWTGERLLFGWTDNSNDDVYLDRATADGVSVEAGVVDQSGELASLPRFATNGTRTVMVYGRRESGEPVVLRIRILDRAGHDLAEPLTLAAPSADEYWREPQVATRPDGGFVILAVNESSQGWLRARLDAEGRLVSGPELVADQGRTITIGGALSARPSGMLVAGNASTGDGTGFGFVEALDADGNKTDEWTTAGEPLVTVGLGWPSLTERDGRIFVAYTDLGSGEPDYPWLQVIELGCGGQRL